MYESRFEVQGVCVDLDQAKVTQLKKRIDEQRCLIDDDFGLGCQRFMYFIGAMLATDEIVGQMKKIPLEHGEVLRLANFICGKYPHAGFAEPPRNVSFREFDQWKDFVWGMLEAMKILGIPCKLLIKEFNHLLDEVKVA